MDKNAPDIIDAEFKVIREPSKTWQEQHKPATWVSYIVYGLLLILFSQAAFIH